MYNSLRVMLLLASVLASVGQPVGCEAAVLGMRVTAHLPPTWPVARWMVEGQLLGLYSENTRGLTATGSPNCEPRRVSGRVQTVGLRSGLGKLSDRHPAVTCRPAAIDDVANLRPTTSSI
jgi:hypothetical protein